MTYFLEDEGKVNRREGDAYWITHHTCRNFLSSGIAIVGVRKMGCINVPILTFFKKLNDKTVYKIYNVGMWEVLEDRDNTFRG